MNRMSSPTFPFLSFHSKLIFYVPSHSFFTVPGLTDEGSFEKCYKAAKPIIASVHELSGSSFEVGLLASFLNWVWAVAGRTSFRSFESVALRRAWLSLSPVLILPRCLLSGTLVRALAIAMHHQDVTATLELTTDIQIVIRAMHANRSPVGGAFLALPTSPSCHPRFFFFSARTNSPCSIAAHCAGLLTTLLANPSELLPYFVASPPRPRPQPQPTARTSDCLTFFASLSSTGLGGDINSGDAMTGIWDFVEEAPIASGLVTGQGGDALQELDDLARDVAGNVGGDFAGWS
jgi:hypothetical protein